MPEPILSPDHPSMQALTSQLAAMADATEPWPAEQIQLCADHGVFAWFVARDAGDAGGATWT